MTGVKTFFWLSPVGSVAKRCHPIYPGFHHRALLVEPCRLGIVRFIPPDFVTHLNPAVSFFSKKFPT